jgi:formamidopyrimidine-DNA glycosylase
MPEGPEVQTVVNALNHTIIDKTILGSDILDHDKLPVGLSADAFNQRIHQQQIGSTHRRGKYINIKLISGDFIVIHLMMTGHLVLVDDDMYPRFTRLVLCFDDHTALCFADLRRFGLVTLLTTEQMTHYKGFQNLGIDIFGDDFTLENFGQVFNSRRKIHTLLLDQSRISGLGNIYVSESLFRAHIHPLRPAETLNEAEIARLFEASREVTQDALKNLGTTFSDYRRPDGGRGQYQNYLRVFRKEGDPCPNCGTPIERIKIGGRSAFYCPHEQQ